MSGRTLRSSTKAIMTTVKAFITARPVLSYYVVVFALSWGGVLIVVGPAGFPGTTAQVERLMPLVILTLLVGPAVGGPLLTGIAFGQAGFREFFSRLFTWHITARWYAVALLTAPLLMLAILLALSLISPVFVPGIFRSEDKATLVLAGLATALGAGFFEELGWTGFSRARNRHFSTRISTPGTPTIRRDRSLFSCPRRVGRQTRCERTDRRESGLLQPRGRLTQLGLVPTATPQPV